MVLNIFLKQKNVSKKLKRLKLKMVPNFLMSLKLRINYTNLKLLVLLMQVKQNYLKIGMDLIIMITNILKIISN